MSVTTSQAITLLENVLFEQPSVAKANAASWVAQSVANPSEGTIAGLAAAMAASTEGQIAQQVVRYYMGALGRVPAGSEIQFYVKFAEQGLTAADLSAGASAVPVSTWSQIATFFSDSPEFSKDYGISSAGTLDPSNQVAVITAFYQNVLDRLPTASEVAFYQNALNTAGTDLPTLLQYFTNSPEYQSAVSAGLTAALSSYGTSVAGGTTPATIPYTIPNVTLTATLGATNVTLNGTVQSRTVTVTGTPAQAAQTAVAAVTGVIGVTGVPASTGVQPVTAVTAVTPVAGKTAQSAVTDGSVTINDANSSASGTGAITTVTLASSGAGSVINDNGLTTLSLSGTTGTLAITNINSLAIAGHSASLALTLNGLSNPANTITDTNNEIASLTVTTATADSTLAGFVDTHLTSLTVTGTNKLTLNSINSSLTSLTVSGSAGFSDGASVHGAGLSARGPNLTITDTSSGRFSAVLDDTAMNFTGGSGATTITVSALNDATHTISGGSSGKNELIFEGGPYGLTSASAGKFVNFQTIGVAANVSGTIDLSVIDPAASSFEVMGAGTISFVKAAKGASLLVDPSAGATISVAYADSTGASDGTSVTMSSNIASLSLQDAAGAGIGTLTLANSLSATETNVSAAHVIAALVDNGLSILNVSGNAGLSITALTQTGTTPAAFTINNTATNGNGVAIGTLSNNTLATLAFTGSGASSVGSLTTAVTALSVTNSGTTLEQVGTITDNSLTSLTLGANIALGQAATALTTNGLQDGATTGVKINGASDNAHVTVNLTSGAAAGATDTITLGNGNNIVADASTAGTVKITLGTGANLVELGSNIFDTTASYSVTLAARTATPSNVIFIGSAGNNYATAPNVVISGVSSGDIIAFGNDPKSSSSALINVSLTTATSVAKAINLLEAGITGAHQVTVGAYNGNTYIVESASGTLSATDTTVIEITGIQASIAAAAGHLTIGTTALPLTVGSLPGAAFTIPAGTATNLTLGTGGNVVTLIQASTGVTDTFTSAQSVGELLINYQATSGTDIIQMSGSGGSKTSDISQLIVNDTSTGSAGVAIGAFTDNSLTTATYNNSAATGGIVTQSALTSSSLTSINLTGGVAGQATNTYFLTLNLTNTASSGVTISDSNIGSGSTTMGLSMTGPSLTLKMTGPGTLATGTLADDSLATLNISGSGTGSVTLGTITDSLAGAFTVNDTTSSIGGVSMILSGLSGATSLTFNDSSPGTLTDTSAYTLPGMTALTLNNTGTAQLKVGFGGITANALTAIVISGSGNGSIVTGTITDGTTGDVTVTDSYASTSATSLDLSNFSAANSLTVTDSAGGALSLGANLSDAAMKSLALTNSGAGLLSLGTTAISAAALQSLSLTSSSGGGVTIGTVNSAALSSLSFADNGSGALTMGNLTDTLAGAVTISDSSTSTNLISFGVASLPNATSLTVVDSAKGGLTINNGFTDNNAATMTFGNTGTAALTVTGITDNAATLGVTIQGSGLGGTEAITLNNGSGAGGAFTLTDTSTSTGAAVVTYNAAITNGPGTITVTDSATGGLTLGSFTDTNLTQLTLSNSNSGSGTLTMQGVTNGTASGAGLFTTLTTSGGNAISLSTLTLGNDASQVVITNGDSGAVTIGALTIGAPATPNASVSITNSSGAGNLTVGGGTVYMGGGTTASPAIEITNNSSSGSVSVTLTDSAATATTVGLMGSGAQSLTLTDTAGRVDLTTSDANNNVSLTYSGMTGDTITLGNGTNNVTLTDTSLSGAVTVTFGLGTSHLTLQAGHTTAATLVFKPASTSNISETTATANVVTGFVFDNGSTQDTISLGGFTVANVIQTQDANSYKSTGVWTSANGILSQTGASLLDFISDVQNITQAGGGTAGTSGIAAFLDGKGNSWIAYNDHNHNVAVIELANVTITGLDIATGTTVSGIVHIV